ncbi:MAG: translocation/assembly module TamB domain-containing protein, partial [Parabacteroides sp.]|nr:translocation/assembly module TamB domain-containing protein [Parabacteroides sp.]
SENSHQVDIHFLRDRKEISSATAFYQAGVRDSVSGAINITDFPLEMVNPFIPDGMARMQGFLQGNLDIKGRASDPRAAGSLQMDSASVFVVAAGSTYRFDNKKLEIENNKLLFSNYNLYAYGKNPFVINGDINFSDPARVLANLKLNAENLQLVDVKRNKESLVYGKLFVNLNSTLRGPLDAITMRGNLQVLGNTDLTYVLKDSPLTVQDRLSDLVTFTSFTDTLYTDRMEEIPPLQLGGMDMLLTIHIDPAVRLQADLSADQESRIELEGGGDLYFQYTPQGDMFLNGRYTLSGGSILYTLPVIPKKKFTIKEDSYVEWNGDPMNPVLNLQATERVRTAVTLNEQTPRQVNFDVGISLKQRMSDMQLEFTLNAPEDLTMQNQLSAMGEEERSKQAVSMLVTGMYLGSGSGTGKVNMNMGAALNSFLQKEITNLAGSALKTVDISLGVESSEEETGEKRTDYSFRFAKRFYNDRIRVVLGGRISTGNVPEQNQTFIDNISFEYRLDNSGTRYVKLFHNKNYESILEGEITETGAGIVLRRKMKHIGEFFIFRKPKKITPVNENNANDESNQ